MIRLGAGGAASSDVAITMGWLHAVLAAKRVGPNAKKCGDASSGSRSWNVPSSRPPCGLP